MSTSPEDGGSASARRKLRRKRIRGISAFVVPLVLFVIVILVLGGTLTLLDPRYGIWEDANYASWGNQSFTLSGLEQPVTVVRDGAGTVHIYASDDQDLFYAQGFAQASDRLFQMEAQSLMAQGNLSSWVGESAVQSDMSFWYLGIPEAATKIVDGLPAVDPGVASDMQAYSDGVNAYISMAEANHAIPFEFKALGVEPYTWSPYATICFERLMVLSQTGGLVEPLMAGLAAATIGDAAMNAIYPMYSPYWQNFTVLPGDGTVNNATLESQQGVNSSYVFSQDWSAGWATGVPKAEEESLVPLYRAVYDNISDPYLQGFGAAATSEGVGSNSWVVAANKTGIGLPLLANDPHLNLYMPSLWVPTELFDPNYDVSGWALAGVPGILIGHNNNMAWGITYAAGATALDYVETLRGDSYLNNGTWQAMTFQNVTMPVNGGSSISVSIPWTNNGPVVARIGNYGVSVRWDGSRPTWEIRAYFDFGKTVSISQMTGELKQYWDIPALNFVMAEHNSTTGANHIGWIIPAHYPLLNVTMPNGENVLVIGSRGPLNGSGQFEPASRVPPDLSPQVVDPARGYIYAPNQATVGQDYPYPFIGSWWDTGGRAHTIGTYLNTHSEMPIANMEALQANVTDSWAVMFSPQLVTALTNVAATGDSQDAPLATAALSYVERWNGSFYVGEVAPTIYSYWVNEIQSQVFTPVETLAGVNNYASPDPNDLLNLALTDPNSSWFPGGWDAVSYTAATDALTYLSLKLGTGSSSSPDLSGWTWGRVHTISIPSVTGYSSLGMGPYPGWGDTYTPSVAPFAINITMPLTEVTIGSSLRMVTAPSASPAYGIIPGGASGNIGSNYYANQLPLWLNHQYVSMTLVNDPSGIFPEGVVSTWNLKP
jgi:penicillin amidase